MYPKEDLSVYQLFIFFSYHRSATSFVHKSFNAPVERYCMTHMINSLTPQCIRGDSILSYSNHSKIQLFIDFYKFFIILYVVFSKLG